MTEATVETHVNRVLAKVGLTAHVQLVVLAYESRVVRPVEVDDGVGPPVTGWGRGGAAVGERG